ncbi:hypothetical protein [Rhizobium sp. L43]|uniref:hypothetical protein n=1 Tax=Rhizobium sp. L43 TaxID=2035452 RepID=UPI000BE97049|nr:hypothetical protein [Rhizobium sp. L43]PDS75648.1 hypothetical protein CO667_25490 [Rhizobium sp. L43]
MGSSAMGAGYPDTRPQGFHPNPETDLQKYTYDKLLEYWSMVYTLGLLGGVLGSAEEQKAAREAVLAAMEDAVKEAMGLVEAAGVAIDDYTPPGLGAAHLGMQRGGLWAAQKVGSFFGYDPGFKGDIENLDRSIRDSVAVDVNQTSQVMKGGKATVEWLGKSTGLYDYKADTTAEDKVIAATQGTVDERHAQVTAALSKVWNALKETALARYNQFLSDWEKGGPSYAFGTLGIDGAFLALELAISAAAGALTAGAGAVALKVAVSIGKKVGGAARKIVIMLKRVGGKVGKTARIELPEAKVVEHAKAHKGFGDDQAGLPKSTHENVKDPGGPETAEKKKFNYKEMSDKAEGQARKKFSDEGYSQQLVIQNPQGNGVDLIGRDPTTNKVIFGEVKSNGAILSEDQSYMGGPAYVRDRLERVTSQSGEWKNATPAQVADAQKALRWLDESPDFKEIKYDVDADTGAVTNYRERDWNYAPGERESRVKWYDGSGGQVTSEGKPIGRRSRSRGPPKK